MRGVEPVFVDRRGDDLGGIGFGIGQNAPRLGGLLRCVKLGLGGQLRYL